ncbi:MAG: lipid-A-disaccharide synthase N-terminal domain-containing protein [Rhodanobacteraceae bacterium]
MSESDWLALGLIGQAVFVSRFVVQWICSEREHRSTIPMTFWYLSIAGGALLFVYAVYLRDPVFIVSQFGGVLIYLRNIQLRRREARAWTQGGDR